MENEIDETNGTLDAPQKWRTPTTRMTSVNIVSELYDLAKKCNITFKEAMEFGIKFLIADQDGFDYPDCELQKKLHKIVKHRNALMQERDALREQIAPTEEIQEQETKEDLNDVFQAKPSEVKKDVE